MDVRTTWLFSGATWFFLATMWFFFRAMWFFFGATWFSLYLVGCQAPSTIWLQNGATWLQIGAMWLRNGATWRSETASQLPKKKNCTVTGLGSPINSSDVCEGLQFPTEAQDTRCFGCVAGKSWFGFESSVSLFFSQARF